MITEQAQWTPTDWVDRLERKLTARQTKLKLYDDYLAGKHPLGFSTDRFKAEFGELFASFANNWMRVCVEAFAERLDVQGFRLDQDDAEGDDDAWAIWQRNYLDADAPLAHRDAIAHGVAYWLVWGDADDKAVITAESAHQCIIAYAPGSRRERLAMLKMFQDEWSDTQFATLYLPDAVYKFQRRKGSDGLALPSHLSSGAKWEKREARGEPWPLPNPLGVVPGVALRNDPPSLILSDDEGQCEFASVIPIQKVIDKLSADLVISSEFGAFRQRTISGLDIEYDEHGNKTAPFQAGADRIWQAENPDVKFGEYSATDLGGYIEAINHFVESVAAQKGIPQHRFIIHGQYPSSDSLKASEATLIQKTMDKQRQFGEAHEEAMRLAFLVEGDKDRADSQGAETIWRNPEIRNEAVIADMLVKLDAVDVPRQVLWEMSGFFSPQQIKRFPAQLAQQRLTAAAFAPPAPAPAPAPTEDDTAPPTSAATGEALSGAPA